MTASPTTISSSDSKAWTDVSKEVIQSIEQAIQDASDELRAVSLDIHSHPEVAWEEHHAHDALAHYMEKKGFQVERHAYGLETAWKATYEVGQGGRTIGFNSESEYDRELGLNLGNRNR